jgi:hypothetical protein
MQIKYGPTIHQGQFVATVEQHRIWRYIIKRVDSEEVLYEGWSGELGEAVQTADRHIARLCTIQTDLAKAS